VPYKNIFDLIAYQRRYAKKNRHKQRIKARVHYLKNRDTYIRRARLQRITDPEKKREEDRLYYQRNKAEIKKRANEYYKNNTRKVRETVKIYRQKNLKLIALRHKKYYEKNKPKILNRNKQYYFKNKIKLNAASKRWREKNPEKARTAYKKWFERKPEARIAQMVRSRLYKIMGRKALKEKSVFNICGCSYETLRRHIERQFEPGMSWENRSRVWHVDHKIPISLFEKDQIVQANHFSNLRPMFARKNISRGNRLGGHFVLRGKRILEYSD
jgi:hypothetical protein